VVAIAILAIAAATLRPIPGTPAIGPPWCVVCGEFGGTDFVLNIALFIPLGVGLGLTRLHRVDAVAAIVLVTLSVELLQFSYLEGRDASPGDIVANTLGGALGLVAARTAASLIRPRRRLAMILAAAYAAIWLGAMACTVWLWSPSIPPYLYGSQWQPPARAFVPFPGRLLELSMNGFPLAPASMMRLQHGVPPLGDGIGQVVAVMEAGPPPPALAPIARMGRSFVEAFLLGRDGSHLTFRTRLRAADARFRVPMIVLENAFRETAPDDTVRALAGLRDNRLQVRAESERGVTSREMNLTPGLGWTMLMPATVGLGKWSTGISALWVWFSLVPLGFWSAIAVRRGGERRRLVMMSVPTLAAFGLTLLPRIIGGAGSGIAELAGAAAGLICGALLPALIDHKRS
jgi:hypothetical protein